jgi:hypothetical protein
MPYKTKAERERENWMTLPEAVTHILSAEKSDDVDAARRQLRAALADDALRPLRWERETDDRPPFGSTSIISLTDTPPSGRDWLNAEIRWRSGRVRDDWDEFKNGKTRVLLILRHCVARLWKPSVRSDSTTDIVTDADKIVPFSRRKTGPKSRKLQSIADAMRDDIRANRLTEQELRAMPDKELVSRYGEPFGGERTSCRDARDRALTEFDGNPNSGK